MSYLIIAVALISEKIMQLIAPAYCPKWKLYGIQTITAARLSRRNQNPLDTSASGNNIPAAIGKISQADVAVMIRMVHGIIIYSAISQIGYLSDFFSQK